LPFRHQLNNLLEMIGARRALPLKKGGICRIDMAGSRTAGELIWFAPPRLLRRSQR
jgi:hypothetical protein